MEVYEKAEGSDKEYQDAVKDATEKVDESDKKSYDSLLDQANDKEFEKDAKNVDIPDEKLENDQDAGPEKLEDSNQDEENEISNLLDPQDSINDISEKLED